MNAEVKDKELKDHQKLITVKVDGIAVSIEKGKYLVSEFKKLVGVNADYELDEVIKGVFSPLSDSAAIHVKNNDVFVSHVRQGGSS